MKLILKLMWMLTAEESQHVRSRTNIGIFHISLNFAVDLKQL